MRVFTAFFKFLKNLYHLREFEVISIQMGKVGSSSILKSFPKSYQGHSWDAELPVKYFSSRNTNTIFGYLFSLLRWRIKFFFVSKKLKKDMGAGRRLKLIIGVREPVARNISGYFQSLNPRESDFDVDSQITKFWCFSPHMSSLFWMDNEVKRHFGIDVYDFPFDKEAGYSIFSSGIFDVLVYKLEMLSSLEKQIGSFLDCPDFRLINDNLTSDTAFSVLYKDFCNRIRVSKEYLDLLYSSKYVRHFYSDSEIDSFYKKWLR